MAGSILHMKEVVNLKLKDKTIAASMQEKDAAGRLMNCCRPAVWSSFTSALQGHCQFALQVVKHSLQMIEMTNVQYLVIALQHFFLFFVT